MVRWNRTVFSLWVVAAAFLLALAVPALAQPPASNPNEMCGDGTTFTIDLPAGENLLLPLPPKDTSDSVTLPMGCSIYALFVGDHGHNDDLDELGYYNLAKFIAENNGYVHYAWWNNLLKEYMGGPLHDIVLANAGECLPSFSLFGRNLDEVCGPLIVRGYPGTGLEFYSGLSLIDFANTFGDIFRPSGLFRPADGTQFKQDAEIFLQAIRLQNPNAIIIVVGNGKVAGDLLTMFERQAGRSRDVDVLAVIDPVGHLGGSACSTIFGGGCPYAWADSFSHWRAATYFRGFRRRDCVRNSLGLCQNFGTFFGPQYRCQSVGGWLNVLPLIKSFAPLRCSGPEIDTGTALVLSDGVRNLYHRWQSEGGPADFDLWNTYPVAAQCSLPGCRPRFPLIQKAGFSTDPAAVLVNDLTNPNFQKSVVGSPIDTCSDSGLNDPRDGSLPCNAKDGREELLGFRGKDEPLLDIFGFPIGTRTRRLRKGVQAQNWPADAAGRRTKLIEMGLPDPNRVWPQRPQNPDLCLVCDELITIVQRLLAEQQTPPSSVDVIPPNTLATLTPLLNGSGWANDDVLVTLLAADETGGSGVKGIEYSLSGAQSGSLVVLGDTAQEMVSAEGATTIFFLARDNADNAETAQSVEVKIDKTPPQIAAVTDVLPNANGWIKFDVLVSFPASDGGSGLASSSADQVITTEGVDQEIIGTAEDVAGNQAAASVVLSIDKIAPGITLASRTPAANAAGWNNTDVTFTWDCTDALSGPASPSVTEWVTTEGAAQMVIGTCADLADNTASDTQADIHLDKTAPAISGSASPAANANGWNNSNVTVSFTCSDPLSGLAAGSPPADTILSGEGAGQSAGGNCSDVASNSASASLADIHIDQTAPSVAGTPDRAADRNGWYNHALTVAWSGTDALSGIATCDSDSHYAGPDSAAASVSGSCSDRADNSAGRSVNFQYDATAPQVSLSTPPDGAVYLLNAAVNAAYSCTDNLSGVASCNGTVASGAAVNTSTVGSKQFTVGSNDVAGNSGTQTNSYSVQYAFSGFANPIGPMPMINVAKAGRTVPVKYNLRDANGTPTSDLSSFVSLLWGPIACDSSTPGVLVEETDAAGSTTIRYDSETNQFIYNWKTDSAWAGTCRALQLALNDGTQHVVFFQFK